MVFIMYNKRKCKKSIHIRLVIILHTLLYFKQHILRYEKKKTESIFDVIKDP